MPQPGGWKTSRLVRGLAATGIAAGLVLPSHSSAQVVTLSPPPYPCSVHQTNDGRTIQGLFGDAGLIGWEGDQDGVVACLGGSFYLRDGRNATYGFGVYNDSPTEWSNADGYLPALVTSFRSGGADVSITNFADRVMVGGHAYVVVYSRVRAHNPSTRAISLSPAASPGLVPLDHAPATVPAGSDVVHDYAIGADRFGATYPWPADTALAAAGGFDAHFAHMRAFWDRRLATITQLASLPDRQLGLPLGPWRHGL